MDPSTTTRRTKTRTTRTRTTRSLPRPYTASLLEIGKSGNPFESNEKIDIDGPTSEIRRNKEVKLVGKENGGRKKDGCRDITRGNTKLLSSKRRYLLFIKFSLFLF